MMAKSSKRGHESWLPNEFFAVEDLAVETEILEKNVLNADVAPGSSFPMEFPYEFDSFGSLCSATSSPGESVVGSTETESSSDDEDFLTGLTRRLSQSSLSGTRKHGPMSESKYVMAGSPDAILGGTEHWSVSINGSRSGVSPHVRPFGFGEGYNSSDLIHEAAGQLARLKMSNEAPKVYNSNFQAREVLKSQTQFCETRGYTCNEVLQMNLQCQRARLEHLIQQQRLKQLWAKQVTFNQKLQNQQSHCGSQCAFYRSQNERCVQPVIMVNQQSLCGGQRTSGLGSGRCRPPVAMGMPHPVWHHLQRQSPLQQSQQYAAQSQHSKPGTKAIVLDGSGVKRECAGTGVFLPRKYGNTPEPCKTSGCSAAMLPAKVVHALNLSFQRRNEPTINNVLSSDYGPLAARRNVLLSLQKRMLPHENHELGLPQEWTY